MHAAPAGWDAAGSPYQPHASVEVVVLPSLLDLQHCIDAEFTTGAQYGNPEDEGAFTGDVSMAMIRKAGAEYVLCGHSERRQHHHETDAMIAAQVASALRNGLRPILCVGETADQREMDQTNEVVRRQLAAVTLTKDVIVAYEPAWAIGTGKTPTPKEAQDTHAFIRGLLPSKDMQILYGGSLTDKNAKDFLSQPDIDGGLVGGASLDPKVFSEIVTVAASFPS